MTHPLWVWLDANAPALAAVVVAFLIGVDLGKTIEKRQR